jgi:hypothetical protein
MHHKARAFRIEAAPQHRRDELHPLSIVLQTARDGLLVGADTDIVDADA